MAREKLIAAGKKLGINVKIEAQGSAGIEYELTEEDIKNADAVIIASDVVVSGKKRFKGKPLVEVPVAVGIKSPENLLNQIKTKLGK
jgi:PTS system fructose-specific IIB component